MINNNFKCKKNIYIYPLFNLVADKNVKNILVIFKYLKTIDNFNKLEKS